MAQRDAGTVLDLWGRLAEGGSGALAGLESTDLDVNLVRFAARAGVAPHVNSEVDVLLVVLAGEGVLTLDGVERPLAAGTALIIPKGAERGVRSVADGSIAYLTVHRRRGRLWPTSRRPLPGAPSTGFPAT